MTVRTANLIQDILGYSIILLPIIIIVGAYIWISIQCWWEDRGQPRPHEETPADTAVGYYFQLFKSWERDPEDGGI